MTGEVNQKLFPAPSRDSGATNGLAPRIWPGVSAASTAALQEILTDNHKRWHVFFNERGFHNHTAHAVLTMWSLGVHESLLHKSYEEESKYQRPAFTSPSVITKKNWKDHLGDENYYQAYRDFFVGEVEKKSFGDVLEEYIFSNDANVVAGANKTQPQMLNRFMAGLLHPMIHTGFGVEFNLPGIFAEGMGQSAVHPAEATQLHPATWWTSPTDTLSSRFASAVNIWGEGKAEKKDVHAFTVLARLLADPALAPTKVPDMYGFFAETVRTHGESITKYVDQWTLGGDLQKKLEELIWTNALIYGVGGSKAPTFNADFFHMHLVTSSVFLSTIFARLKRSSQVIFLRNYFAVCLGWYVGRGRPALDLGAFFQNATTLEPHPPGAQPIPHDEVRPSPTSPHALTPDPWLAIIQSTLVYPDDHLPKLQRALSEHSSHFGTVRAGTFAGTELEGAELIDGTLFIRAAGLTANRLGWVREGQGPLEGVWDRHGFFNSAKL